MTSHSLNLKKRDWEFSRKTCYKKLFSNGGVNCFLQQIPIKNNSKTLKHKWCQ